MALPLAATSGDSGPAPPCPWHRRSDGSVARYAHAADRLDALRQAWEDAGAPATATGSSEQVIADPLLAELRLTEASVTALAEVCGIRSHPGRFGKGDHRAQDRKARPSGFL